MLTHPAQTKSWLANAIFALLNPIPYGFFVAALIFDAIYARSGEILWVKSSAWLITLGLLFAILPRLINLVHVCLPATRSASAEKVDFWLNLVAVLAAIANAFVHSRDAYGTMPAGLLLSILTTLPISLGFIILAVRQTAFKGAAHE